MEELEEEILIRFPPHEPALVCKRWRRLVSGPAFRRRFRELHRTPPMLGFLCNIVEDAGSYCFVPTAGAFRAPGADLCQCRALDARHGRVLLKCPGSSEGALVVWDPSTDEKLELSIAVLGRYAYNWTAAILCAACGTCNHLDCHHGPFLVVYVACGGSREAFICTYSSDAGTWSEPITTELQLPSDLVTLMPGGLALATVHEYKLCIWRKAGREDDAGWTQNMVIELESLLPRDAILASPNVVGFADGIGVIFLSACCALFTIDLNTYKAKKVFKGKSIYVAIVYINFYTP
uniref:F-box domain-containing protein n=1 Tax=Setaria italica TaxID=4555 RepID=K3YCG5_SETIT